MPQWWFKDISPAALTVDYGSSGHANLTYDSFLGAVKFTKGDQTVDVFEEGYGDAPVDTIEKGTVIELEAPFVRVKASDWYKLFPNKIDIQSGDEFIWKNLVGYDYFANSRNLVIRPLVNNVVSTDPSEWFFFPHAHPYDDWDLPWDRETQRVLMVKFKVHPIQSGTRKGHLFRRGV